MFNKIKNWLKPDENYQVGRPKIAEQKLKKTVKIEIALAFVLCATLVLSGTSALTGKSPIELLSFGSAGKASGNVEGKTIGKASGTYALKCGSKTIGSYQLYYTNANALGGKVKVDRQDKFSTWSRYQKVTIQILSGTGGKVHAFRYKIVNDNGTNENTLCSGRFAIPTNDIDKYESVVADVTLQNVTMKARIYGGGSYTGTLTKKGVNEIGGSLDFATIKLDNSRPIITKLNLSKVKGANLVILASVKDGGEGNGKMVYNIYTFNKTIGKELRLVTSKSELYGRDGYESKSIKFSDGNSDYKLIASLIDDVGNKGIDREKCFSIISGNLKNISCNTKVTTTTRRILRTEQARTTTKTTQR